MKTPEHFRMPIADAFPYVTAASLETLIEEFERDRGMPASALNGLIELRAAVNHAIMIADDPKLAYNRTIGELLGWDN